MKHPFQTISRTFWGSIFLACCAISAAYSDARPDEHPKPNIIFLLADDMRHDDMSFIDPVRAHTPHLDRLAKESTVFRNGYVTTAICVVSRASIFTGQYARRHGIYRFRTPFTDAQWKEVYPAVLRRNGYATGFVGKYGINIWVPDEQKQYPKDEFDYWFVPGPGSKEFLQDESGRDVHYTQMLGRKAVEFIRQAQDGPFCLSLSFLAPHGSLNPNPTFKKKFQKDTFPLPPTYADKFFHLLPEAPFHEKPNFGRNSFKKAMPTYPDFLEYKRNRKNKVYGMDLVIGRIRHELEALGLNDNTIIIFSSDHGHYSGEHGLNGKWWMHESSIRTPMILHDPRKPASARQAGREEMVLNIDIAPTILDYAGLTPPSGMQGRSMKPLVDGKSAPDWRTEFYYEQHFDLSDTKSDLYIAPVEGVVTPRYKYMFYFQDDGAEELYDVLEDPLEINNLVQDPSHRDVLELMREKYRQMKSELL